MKQLILILGMMTAANISAQLNLYENGFKPLYWGISLGINSYNYNVNRMPFSTMNDSIRFSYGSPGPGYNLGAIGNFQINQLLDIRTTPNMFFTESFIEYESYSGFVHSKNLKNIYISLPLLLRFKTMPINDFRIFVLGGMCYNINIVEQKIPKFDQSFIAMTRNAISFEYGVGLQYFFKYFIFSPEIKFGHYMQSHLESIQSPLNNSILNQVYPKYFIISLNFEG